MKKDILLISFLIIGLLGGYYFSKFSDAMSPDHITIRIVDISECKEPNYTIELKDKNIHISGAQINYEYPISGKGSDTIVTVLPKPNNNNYVYYKLRASYKNCRELLSERRKVERGMRLYETIKNNKIEHLVRK